MNKKLITLVAASLFGAGIANAQLNKNTCKFLGNITTRGQIQPNVSGLKYEAMWDQLTCENESKWGEIVNCKVSSAQEGIQKWKWSSSDSHYKWCKQNNVLFKFHCLVWTSQFPSVLSNCSPSELKQQIGYWMDAVAIKYPDLAIIDVVNEAIPGHAEGGGGGDFKKLLSQALGNSGTPSDYKWITEAFKMARERFPNAVLIYNDYNTLTHQKSEFISLVSTLVKQGAPIDAYGHQTHDLDDYYQGHGNSMSGFENNLKDIHDQITRNGGRELQCYITEYDINQANDNTQLEIMKGSFPAMWEADYVSGITIWGYINGATWRSNTGLVSGQGQDRASMKWLREYMASDKAKAATAKFCGKEAGGPAGPSASVEVSKSTIVLGKSVDFSVTLKNSDSGIKSVTYYAGDTKIGEGESFTWTPEEAGNYSIKVIVITNSNDEVKGSSSVKVVEPNKPYGGSAAVIPGKIEAENYDEKLLDRFETAKDVIAKIRAIRQESQIAQKTAIEVFARLVDGEYDGYFDSVVIKHCNLSALARTDEAKPGSKTFVAKNVEYFVPMSGSVDVEEEIKKLQAELDYTRGFLASVEKKLSNERFVSGAPAAVVEREKQKQADALVKIEALEKQIANFKA